jgi:hypothetical protein
MEPITPADFKGVWNVVVSSTEIHVPTTIINPNDAIWITPRSHNSPCPAISRKPAAETGDTPSERIQQLRHGKQHEARPQHNRSAEQALRYMPFAAFETHHDVPCAGGETRARSDACKCLAEQELPISPRTGEGEVRHRDPGQRRGNHAPRAEAVRQASAGHLHQCVREENSCG